MQPVISTIRDRCRRCYACVRHCPAKAIRVRDGQATVLVERCIACGRCVGVCAQRAKQVASTLPTLRRRLAAASDPVALLAPTFPAAFPDWRPGQLVAALRRAGFRGVFEVAFGADLVSRAYRRLRDEAPDALLLTTPCPAACAYVEKYVPELVGSLAPLLSPMAAMGKALKQRLRPGCETAFFGPCVAKLRERDDPNVAPWVDLALTFSDLRELLAERGVDPLLLPDEPFDPPHAALGAIYPLAGALLRVADLPCDLLASDVATVVGRETFTDSAERLRRHVVEHTMALVEARFFDVLFCKGCIGGPDMPSRDSLIVKKQRVIAYWRTRAAERDTAEWARAMAELSDLDLGRSFQADPQPRPNYDEAQIREVLRQSGKPTPSDELDCGACGYATCRDKAIAVLGGVAEVEMCLPFLVDRLEATVVQLHCSHEDLQEAHTQLLRSERLASMGQLAAGIAHELNNPLGTILIFAHLLQDAAQQDEQTRADASMILREATRCKGIVGGLLDFARQNKVCRRPVDVAGLLRDATELVRVQLPDAAVDYRIDVPANMPACTLDEDQMKQVLVNLVRNAVDALPNGGAVRLCAWCDDVSDELRLTVADTGAGIPAEHMHKLFSPFFTTKPVGQGTGLGLPICYGIVKMHRGAITARNNEDGPGACFDIRIPLHADAAAAPLLDPAEAPTADDASAAGA